MQTGTSYEVEIVALTNAMQLKSELSWIDELLKFWKDPILLAHKWISNITNVVSGLSSDIISWHNCNQFILPLRYELLYLIPCNII